ncbi:MAG: hypothetical protein KKE84_05405 [Gammaproteobacteria bacterium]|nr:hypothetical protein [Gammaproteobacteria bacterium]
MASILQPGHNCWRIEPASRASVLVDGAAPSPATLALLAAAMAAIALGAWKLRNWLIRTGRRSG